MEGSKVIGTSMSPSCKLDKDEGGKNVDLKFYRGMIDSLLYLTASRPDVAPWIDFDDYKAVEGVLMFLT